MPEPAGTLTAEQVSQLLGLLEEADSVELKVSVPDEDRQSAVFALGLDPLAAQLRQVVFFDTPDLRLDRNGVVVRARRVQGKRGDSIVKLRPLDPHQVPASVRTSPAFGIEIDAMPGGFVCSGRMKARIDDDLVKKGVAGRASPRGLLTVEQSDFFAAHAPEDVGLDDLSMLGPINVLKLKFTSPEFGRPLVAELWLYPDGTRILELSIKCRTTEAFEVAAEARVFLAKVGIDLLAEQHTKTRRALDFYAGDLVGGR